MSTERKTNTLTEQGPLGLRTNYRGAPSHG